MASRRFAHITAYEGSSLVAPFNDGPPLLPYERQLIATIGISESEYRQRLRELYSIANRPAGYGHIPDVQNDPVITPILVSLAVGLVTTGISMLLAPKPPGAPDEPRKIVDKQLPNETGRQRFNQTKGFQGAPALATLALLLLTSSAITTHSKALRTAKRLSQAGSSLNLCCFGHGWSANAPTKPSSC